MGLLTYNVLMLGDHDWQADVPVWSDDAAADHAAGQGDDGAGGAAAGHHPVLHSGAAGQREPEPANAAHKPRQRPAGHGRHAATLPLPQASRLAKSNTKKDTNLLTTYYFE
jgi:hypothetical protein